MLSWAERLEELKKLAPGWCDGDGEIPSPETFKQTAILVQALMAGGMDEPQIYPSPDGVLVLEWCADRKKHDNLSIEIHACTLGDL